VLRVASSPEIEFVVRNRECVQSPIPDSKTDPHIVFHLPVERTPDWTCSEEETLDALLKLTRPDEKNVLLQLDKVLVIENEMKHLQLGMMLKIKLILSPDQQSSLRELRKQGQRKGMTPPPPRPEDQ
jgi:hypothetical protein